ncbi:MAG: hypothetical protein A4E53_03373 [Pelotomaculum sp. PtaB.Bin104]|nr:MAG: hypothetical protein A4E53_03373 [Pelotomaculum sp. PtaB.Bin104]
MKKLKFMVLALALVLALAVPAMAEQVNVYQDNQLVKSVVFKIGVPYYVVSGQTPGVKMDVAPFIENDRTFVPVRFLGNALGLSNDKITWDNDTQTATLKGSATLQMSIGKAQIVSNGQAKDIDVSPMLVDPGRTMLPARFVAEGLGYEVEWDEATQIVVCWPQGEPKPDVSGAVSYLTQMQQPEQPLVQGHSVNGYVVPANTNLWISTSGYKNNGSIVFSIDLKKGNLQQQYEDAKNILLQTIDSDTTTKAIDYAKKNQYALENGSRENPIYCPITTFTAPNGMAVRVGGGGGDSIEFQLWQTN